MGEPIGMSGMRLEVKTHIVTGAVSAAQNIVKCVRRCGLEVNDLVLQPLASSYAVLSEDEKDLGVCLIDIGGGTTDLAVWTQGAIRHTSVIPIAGDQITNDIAMALRTPTREAEDIKCKYGCALAQLADSAASMEVAGVDDRPSRKLSRRALADVIQPRVEELYELIQNELRRAGFEEVLSSGIVLTIRLKMGFANRRSIHHRFASNPGFLNLAAYATYNAKGFCALGWSKPRKRL